MSSDLDAKLIEFFPPDDPTTPWLFRLMVIRDDLAFEIENLPWKERDEDGEWKETNAAWTTSYFIRRMSLTLLEARHIFVGNVLPFIKKPTDKTLGQLAHHVRKAIEEIRQVEGTLETMRNSLGGHVRPEPTAIPTVIRNWPALSGQIRIFCEPKAMSYRGLTKEVLPFAWPDAHDVPTLTTRHNEFHAALTTAARETISVADSILLYNWVRIAAVAVGEGHTLTIPDRKEPGLRREVPPPR